MVKTVVPGVYVKEIDLSERVPTFPKIATLSDMRHAIQIGLTWEAIKEGLPVGIDIIAVKENYDEEYKIWLCRTTLGRLLYG